MEDCPTCGGILAREIDLREVIRDHLSSVTAPAPFKRAVQKALRRQREGWVRFSRPWQVAAAIPILVLAVGAFVRFREAGPSEDRQGLGHQSSAVRNGRRPA